MWLRLEEVYQSKGPARKATLLKKLTLHKMADGDDVRAHLNSFFDSVDKLIDMDVDINADLLTILLLYSLPASFENFRCAIESRDELPTPEALRVKIVEESDARKSETRNLSSALFIKKNSNWPSRKGKTETNNSDSEKRKFDKNIRCFKCNKPGHKASVCRSKGKTESAGRVEAYDVCLNISSAAQSDPSRKWCLDSGATSHLCRELDYFGEIDDSKRSKLNLANSETAETIGEGKVHFVAKVSDDAKNVTLSNALYVPELRSNLLSVGKITDRGLTVSFRKDGATIEDANKNVVLTAARVDDLYYIREAEPVHEACTIASSGKVKVSLGELHRRLGHVNTRDIVDAVRIGAIRGVDLTDATVTSDCNICLQSKMTRASFPKKSHRQSNILEIIHTDVCGPMRKESLAGARYFIEFIDDSSRWCEVRFLKSKAEVTKATIEYISLVENQKNTRVKYLQSDNGREYTNSELDMYLKKRGISRRLTAPYNPEQNGIAERRNRTLNDMARCMLLESNLPNSFWAEAVNTANYVRNRVPTKSLNGRTPHELWTGRTPNVSDFRTFGSRVIYLDRDPGHAKHDHRGRDGIFLGYAEESKAYRVWSVDKRRVLITRDVKFVNDRQPGVNKQRVETNGSPKYMELEASQLSKMEQKSEAPIEDDQDSIASSQEDFLGFDIANEFLYQNIVDTDGEEDRICEDDEDRHLNERPTSRRAPGRPKLVRSGSRGRPRKLPNTVSDSTTASIVTEECLLTEVSLKDALNGPEASEWQKAIADEMKSILKKETWTLVDRPEGQKGLGCRFVLRNKFHADGTFEKRKARLVAQGFNQKPGIHFTETFAPVARVSSIRLLASLAARCKMRIRQFDVETAYLNGRLEEEILMEPPKNLQEVLRDIIDDGPNDDINQKARKMLDDIGRGDKVCLLQKSLYGLRQAGRSWYTTLDDTLKKLGATPSKYDPCLFYIGSGKDATLITTYVDDILVASRDDKQIDKIREGLSKSFQIKDIGEVKHCLGIEFGRIGHKITMHQRGYIHELLSRFGMLDCNPVTTPTDPGSILTKQNIQSTEDRKLPYRELVGALTYLATTTRPDIAFAVSRLGQFNNCFGMEHWKAAKRVLRYLKGTTNIGLTFGTSLGPLEGYTDADWGSCSNDRRSYTGYIFLLGGCPISWDAKKQRTVALSTTEAEYMALSEGAKEAMYLRRLLQELGFIELGNVKIFGDNMGSLKLAGNSTFHSRSKHIDIRHHFLRDALKKKEFDLAHVTTENQVADFLTKSLPRNKHGRCLVLAGLQTKDWVQQTHNPLEGKC